MPFVTLILGLDISFVLWYNGCMKRGMYHKMWVKVVAIAAESGHAKQRKYANANTLITYLNSSFVKTLGSPGTK